MAHENQTGVPSFKTTLGQYIEVIPYFQDQYRFLSNFWPTDVAYEGLVYPSAEHAYQSAKFVDETWKKIFTQPDSSASWAKHTGRQSHTWVRNDWEDVKEQVMLDIVRIKFKTPALNYWLGTTGDKKLIEGNHWHDVYWGVCDGSCKRQHPGVAMGYNVLGNILEKVRAENRQCFLKDVSQNVHL